MMRRPFTPLAAVVTAGAVMALTACAPTNQEDLNQWMTDQRATVSSRIKPLSEPTQFQPQAYRGDAEFDPFNPQKLTQALRRDSAQVASNAALIAPELARRKEPLESMPLDVMAMVGYLDKASGPSALLKVDQLIYPVKIGNYLGMNYGKITKITETTVELRELVQDSTGDWVERQATLELQEVKK